VKITDIRTAEVRGHGYSTYVRVYTDEGLFGNGECIHGGEGCAALVHGLKRHLLDEDPLNVDALWEKMRRARLFDGAMAGAMVTAITGIEIALWDLAGKALGVPVYQLLGGKFRDRIRLYCDCGRGAPMPRPPRGRLMDMTAVRDYAPEAYARRAQEMLARGFTALKFDVDERDTVWRSDPWNWHASPGEVAWMVERIAAVRTAIGPQADLAIDMHGRYDLPSAIAVARAMAPFDLVWLEEPVPPENVAAMREVKRCSPVPICAGENLYLRWGFRDLLEQQAVDVIMPDIPKCGGLSECRKIANMAEIYYVPFAPHNVCGPLGTLASAHICATVPNFLLLEWHWCDYEGWDELTLQDAPLLQDGHLVLPQRPGLGVEVNDEALRKYLRPGTELFGERP
jgi:galactonate dehydratase